MYFTADMFAEYSLDVKTIWNLSLGVLGIKSVAHPVCSSDFAPGDFWFFSTSWRRTSGVLKTLSGWRSLWKKVMDTFNLNNFPGPSRSNCSATRSMTSEDSALKEISVVYFCEINKCLYRKSHNTSEMHLVIILPYIIYF